MYKMFASWSTSKWPSVMYNKDDLMFFPLKMFPVTWDPSDMAGFLRKYTGGPRAAQEHLGLVPRLCCAHGECSPCRHAACPPWTTLPPPPSLTADFLNLGRSKLSVIFITFLSRLLWPHASGPQELLCCKYIIQISDFSGSSLNLISMPQVFGKMVAQNMIKSGSWCPCSKDCPQGES